MDRRMNNAPPAARMPAAGTQALLSIRPGGQRLAAQCTTAQGGRTIPSARTRPGWQRPARPGPAGAATDDSLRAAQHQAAGDRAGPGRLGRRPAAGAVSGRGEPDDADRADPRVDPAPLALGEVELLRDPGQVKTSPILAC